MRHFPQRKVIANTSACVTQTCPLVSDSSNFVFFFASHWNQYFGGRKNESSSDDGAEQRRSMSPFQSGEISGGINFPRRIQRESRQSGFY